MSRKETWLNSILHHTICVLILLKRQVIGAATPAADIFEFDAGVGAFGNMPVVAQFRKRSRCGECKDQLHLRIIQSGNPGTRYGAGAVHRGKHVAAAEREGIATVIAGFFMVGIPIISNPPGARTERIAHGSGGRVVIIIVIVVIIVAACAQEKEAEGK